MRHKFIKKTVTNTIKKVKSNTKAVPVSSEKLSLRTAQKLFQKQMIRIQAYFKLSLKNK